MGGNIPITLLTDFGDRDSYVAAMKGVILSINPAAVIVDITHHISPQNVSEGALVLSQAVPYFPKGTIHIAIVDPGVGTARKPLVIETPNYMFVGPDNGIFSLSLQNEFIKRAIHISDSKSLTVAVSPTFHGRDIFAPAAAYLSLGMSVDSLGKKTLPLHMDIYEQPVYQKGCLTGKVIHHDTFGNLVTNISAFNIEELPGNKDKLFIYIGGKKIKGIHFVYGDVLMETLMAVIGSNGLLEIAVRNGNAAVELGASVGDKVTVVPNTGHTKTSSQE